MTAKKIHAVKIKEHLQELKDAIAIGIELRPATIGFHTSACAIDLLELYLHTLDKIPIGKQIKHEWFKRPKPEQKIKPLAERHLPIEFTHKEEIFEHLYTLEEKRNVLIYGHATPSEIKATLLAFESIKNILIPLLQQGGEDIEDPNQ
ncbi:hypothetical protein HYS47_00570 [Candidatus Woesearchaeota archaeon]|nr:hypothetical protein [Candidatus Woesearchaeota archaeon]